MSKMIDETGNRYGQLVVIRSIGQDRWGSILWECKCSCGKLTVACGALLRRGTTKNCGCTRGKEEKPGTRYGNLSVIKFAGKDKTGTNIWLCQCDCGQTIDVLGTSLRSGQIKSCGCLHKLPSGKAAFNGIVRVIKNNAKKRGYEFKLTKKQIKKLIDAPCFYCGALPANILSPKGYNGNYVYNGIDRINNSKGYTLNNVVPCCNYCNKAKLTKTIPEFLDWFKRLIKHNNWNCKNIDSIKFAKELT